MTFIFINDFLTVIAKSVSLVFPKTEFQVEFQDIGYGNIALMFKSSINYKEDFSIKFYPKLSILVLSGFSKGKKVHLIYLNEKNYEWRNKDEFLIRKPSDIGKQFEFLAMNVYPLLQEFLIGEVYEKFSIIDEVETADIEVIDFRVSAQRLEDLYRNQSDLS